MSTAAVTFTQREKPKLRGVIHLAGAVVAMPAVVLGVAHATTENAVTASVVYGLSLLFLLSTSAIYHTPQWTPKVRMWLRRLDHTAIFVLIAGSYTPVCLLVLDGEEGRKLLMAVWACAGAGGLISLLWPTVPRWINVGLTVAMGWMIVPYGKELLAALDWMTLSLLIAGGLLYSIGGIAYARRSPDPVPTIFGYHEVFHTFVLVAVACHFIAFWRVIG